MGKLCQLLKSIRKEQKMCTKVDGVFINFASFRKLLLTSTGAAKGMQASDEARSCS